MSDEKYIQDFMFQLEKKNITNITNLVKLYKKLKELISLFANNDLYNESLQYENELFKDRLERALKRSEWKHYIHPIKTGLEYYELCYFWKKGMCHYRDKDNCKIFVFKGSMDWFLCDICLNNKSSHCNTVYKFVEDKEAAYYIYK